MTRFGSFAVVVLACLLLMACSDDDSGDDASGVSGSENTAVPEQPEADHCDGADAVVANLKAMGDAGPDTFDEEARTDVDALLSNLRTFSPEDTTDLGSMARRVADALEAMADVAEADPLGADPDTAGRAREAASEYLDAGQEFLTAVELSCDTASK